MWGKPPLAVASAAVRKTARIVEDATGRARWLGRLIGIASPPCSPRLLARYGYARGSCPERDQAPALVGDASGWTWTAMVRANTYQWTRLAFDGQRPKSDWMPQEFAGLSPLGPSRSADVTWRLADEAAWPGWFMVAMRPQRSTRPPRMACYGRSPPGSWRPVLPQPSFAVWRRPRRPRPPIATGSSAGPRPTPPRCRDFIGI